MFSGKKVSLFFSPCTFFPCVSGQAKVNHSFSLWGGEVLLSIFLTFKAIFKSLLHLHYTEGGTALSPLPMGACWAGFPGSDFGIPLSSLPEHSLILGYPITIDTTGDNVWRRARTKGGSCDQGQESRFSPTKESWLLYLAGLSEGQRRGLWGHLLS